MVEGSHYQKDNLEKIFQKYESEFNAHTKVEQKMQKLLNEMKEKNTELEKTTKETKLKIEVKGN